MALIDPILAEFKQECAATRGMLAVCPDDLTWKPHPKSMSLGELVSHISDIPIWLTTTLTTKVLDFQTTTYKPASFKTSADILPAFDRNVAETVKAMGPISDSDLNVEWTMRNGEKLFLSQPRILVVRTWCLNHLYHHRGQLSVYLRLKNVPLPGIYGPTADSPAMGM